LLGLDYGRARVRACACALDNSCARRTRPCVSPAASPSPLPTDATLPSRRARGALSARVVVKRGGFTPRPGLMPGPPRQTPRPGPLPGPIAGPLGAGRAGARWVRAGPRTKRRRAKRRRIRVARARPRAPARLQLVVRPKARRRKPGSWARSWARAQPRWSSSSRRLLKAPPASFRPLAPGPAVSFVFRSCLSWLLASESYTSGLVLPMAASEALRADQTLLSAVDKSCLALRDM